MYQVNECMRASVKCSKLRPISQGPRHGQETGEDNIERVWILQKTIRVSILLVSDMPVVLTQSGSLQEG